MKKIKDKIIIKINSIILKPIDYDHAMILLWLHGLTNKPVNKKMSDLIYKAYIKNDWIDLLGLIEYTLFYWNNVKNYSANKLAEEYIDSWQ